MIFRHLRAPAYITQMLYIIQNFPKQLTPHDISVRPAQLVNLTYNTAFAIYNNRLNDFWTIINYLQ